MAHELRSPSDIEYYFQLVKIDVLARTSNAKAV
jgi:hypothetical protein